MDTEKIKEYRRQYYLSNKEKIKEKSKKYYTENIDIVKEYAQKYRGENKEKIKEIKRQYNVKNKELLKIKQKEYREQTKDYQKEYQKKYREKNKEKRNFRERERNQKNPLYKLSNNIRRSIRDSFKRNGYKKNSNTHNILNCSFEQFKEHLENQFQPWMNWDNYGLYNGTEDYGWDIDHIIPLKTAKTIEDIIRLNHYTNLQPLCSYYNRVIKREKI